MSVLALFTDWLGPFGLIILLGLMFCQAELIKIFVKQKFKFDLPRLITWIFLLAWYVVSLCLIYYTFGLSKMTILAWLIINLAIPLVFIRKDFQATVRKPSIFFKNISKIVSRPSLVIVLIICVYLFSRFFAHPILNGSPTPWRYTTFFSFALFFVATFLILRDIIKGQLNHIVAFIYFLLVMSVVAIKYVFSYGYDTLLHQGALKYIVEHGQIEPLTPFYIGQYVIEVLVHFFSGLPFVLIERWLVPMLFVVMLWFVGRYFLEKMNLPGSLGLVAIVALFMLPVEFVHSAPYALSLLFGVVAITGLYLYLTRRDKLGFHLTIAATLISLLVHPFVGLNILIAAVFAYFFQRAKTKIKRLGWLIATFVVSAVIVAFNFALYSWLKDDVITLAHPLYYVHRFLSLFSDPIWYIKLSYPWWLGAIYWFEKIHLFIILAIAVLVIILIKKNRGAAWFVLIVALASLTSSWLFISSLEVSGYSYGDQINYSHRLLQVAQWFLWPLILLGIYYAFKFLTKRRKSAQLILIVLLSILLTTCWYLTYPRNDDISWINVNNIREVDYKAIDFIYEREGGKQGYLVLANQIFGAAAVERYGFKPYYETKWGLVFYYSIPMSGELNKRYERLMSTDGFDYLLAYEALEEVQLDRLYLVTTDYWPLSEMTHDQAMEFTSGYWQIDNQIFIYFFER